MPHDNSIIENKVFLSQLVSILQELNSIYVDAGLGLFACCELAPVPAGKASSQSPSLVREKLFPQMITRVLFPKRKMLTGKG